MATNILKKSIFLLQIFCLLENVASVGNQNDAKKEFLKNIQEARESIKQEEKTKPSEKINNALEKAYKKIFVQIMQKHKYTPEQAETLIGHTLMILQARALGVEAEQNIEKTMKEFSCSRDEALVLVASAIVLKAQTQEIKQEKKLEEKVQAPLVSVKKKASKKNKKSEKNSSSSWENRAFSLLVAAVPAAIGLIGRFIFESKNSNQNQTLILAQNPVLTGMWKISAQENDIAKTLSSLEQAKTQIASVYASKINPHETRLNSIASLIRGSTPLEYQSGSFKEYPCVKYKNSTNKTMLLHTKQGFVDGVFSGIADSLIKDNSQLRIKNLLLNEYRETLLKVFEQKD